MALVDPKTGNAGIAIADREVSSKPSAVAVKNVLFPTDFSSTSNAAMPYAVAICRRFGSTLHLAHVVSDASLLMMSGGVDYVSMGTIYEDAQTEAREKLEHISAPLEGIPHRSYVRHGQMWKSLASIIEEHGIDLIVIGTHGRTGLGKLLLGSVAEDILRHASCPVLTIGPKVSGRAKLPAFEAAGHDLAPLELDLQRIVCAIDFGRSAVRVSQEGLAMAGEFRARLVLMHVIENYTHLGRKPGPMEDSTQRLRELIPAEEKLQYVPETVLEFGSAAERIMHVAQDREADLIVLGARRAADLASTHLPWSTAHLVIAQAHCPVLTIRE